jgi:hypothetical protein
MLVIVRSPLGKGGCRLKNRARCPAVSAVRTDGSWVPVVVRVSCSTAAALLSQVDLRRDRKISQPATSGR